MHACAYACILGLFVHLCIHQLIAAVRAGSHEYALGWALEAESEEGCCGFRRPPSYSLAMGVTKPGSESNASDVSIDAC